MRKFSFRFQAVSCVIVLFLAVAVVLGTPAVSVGAQETLAQSVVRNRDFFVQLTGYGDYMLSDVESLDGGKLTGVILLSPDGFEQHIVFDTQTMIPTYSNARILSKEGRNFLIDTSISMSEVKRLAGAAKIRAAELKRGWTLYEGQPGKNVIIPPSSKAPNKKPSKTKKPELMATVPAVKKKDYDDVLANLRKDIELGKIDKKVAAMTSQEIMTRFMADIREKEAGQIG